MCLVPVTPVNKVTGGLPAGCLHRHPKEGSPSDEDRPCYRDLDVTLARSVRKGPALCERCPGNTALTGRRCKNEFDNKFSLRILAGVQMSHAAGVTPGEHREERVTCGWSGSGYTGR